MSNLAQSGPEKLDTANPSSTRSLMVRFISAVVLIPPVIFIVHQGGAIFAAMVAFLMVLMIFEWTRMVEGRALSAAFFSLAIGGALAMATAAAGLYALAYIICALSGGAGYVFGKRRSGIGLWLGIAAFYILAPCAALLWLRLEAPSGRALTFIIFFVVWAADSGAFLFGKLLGGPKISHALSPSKTWAGIGGGVLGGSLIGAAAAIYFAGAAGPIWGWFFSGGILGAASVAGDLAESAMKRNFGVKDISGLIPGHGGVLDRLDGMIFATATMTAAYWAYMVLELGRG